MIPIPKKIGTLLVLLLCLLYLSPGKAEVFTALADVEPLLETHKKVIDDLDLYIEKEEARIAALRRHLKVYKLEHTKAMENVPNYVGNPVHTFTLIKRLTVDLDKLESTIKIGTEYIKNITMTRPDVKFPSSEDLTGAAQALTRLKLTYALDERELSEGVFNGVKYGNPITAEDCYELGKILYNLKDYHFALPWFMQALRKYSPDDNYEFQAVDIMEYIAFSHYVMDQLDEAVAWTQRLLEIEPMHVRAAGNMPHYAKAIADRDERRRKRDRGETGENIEEKKYNTEKYWNKEERLKYEALCRGEMEIPKEVSNKLYCKYLTDGPFLKIAPIKVEKLYIDPDVFVFHEVLSHEEIDFIKNAARPRFMRAVVHNPATGELVQAHYRISKSAWLRDEEDPIISRVSTRVHHMTGLSLFSAEDLQVVNYGIGGHYEPHFDFSRREEQQAFKNFIGNRIATVLFYMSDVEQGGATVFTELGLSVFPRKGSALFWLNLHPSGEGNFATRHAACPVLLGSKWVCNKWIHQGGQELLKPCTLEYQNEGIIRPIPKPVPTSSR